MDEVPRHQGAERARQRHAAKRGGAPHRITLDDRNLDAASTPADIDVLALDEALTRLAALDAEQARMVELRYFGGLSVTETAEVLKVSTDTVTRDWNQAKAWLYRELSKG